MTDIPHEKPALLKAGNWIAVQMALALALTALTDWFFFGRYLHLGINVPLFALCLCLATVIGTGVQQRGALFTAIVVLLLAVAPAVETLSMLSFLFAAAGVVFFVLFVTFEHTRKPREWLRRTRRLLFGGPFHLCGDLRRFCKVLVRSGSAGAITARVSVWIVPILLGSLFIWIFATANPVIDDVLQSFEFEFSTAPIDATRTVFWTLIFSFVWSFVRKRVDKVQRGASAGSTAKASGNRVSNLIKSETILVSLVLFNLIFAMQTGLDFVYLWGGVTLPDGMTYAEYAHRGAYPLIWAALLSAAFVLIALRPGTSAERTQSVRILVFLWLGQNVLLVFSAAHRLNLYVDAYALTWSRVTAFVWMWLVAVGLVLIIIRIARQRTNRWLIVANAIAVILTFYVYSFVNVDVMIARYNIRHSREVTGSGSWLDFGYLRRLGPKVIPELDAAIELPKIRAAALKWTLSPKERVSFEPTAHQLLRLRSELAANHSESTQNWRAWSFRDHRLARYLATYKPEHNTRESPNPQNF